MLLSEFDYELPEELIAQEPLEDRSASRLLWVGRTTGEIRDCVFSDVVDILREGDLLIANDTRVSALRLFGKKPSGGRVEVLLLHQTGAREYVTMLKPGRRLKVGASIILNDGMEAKVSEDIDGTLKKVVFEPLDGLKDRLDRIGQVPLPPYIHKPLQNPERYQTVFASKDGSAAAPTAGLHFTPQILGALESKGISFAKVTLDVSIDTFRPVQIDNTDLHQMHGEYCTISEETASAIERCKGRIIAVGTTTVRTLESFAKGKRRVEPGRMLTKLFIRPGFEFRVVDGMFTNFHMPRTTMLMMISAFATPQIIKDSYRHAIAKRYRMLSFGDSMLIM